MLAERGEMRAMKEVVKMINIISPSLNVVYGASPSATTALFFGSGIGYNLPRPRNGPLLAYRTDIKYTMLRRNFGRVFRRVG